MFIAHDGAGTRLWVAADLDADVRSLGLDSRPRFDRLIEGLVPDRTRAAGRASTLEIDVGPVRVHVKRALKGGVLAPLFAGRVPFWRRVGNELHVTSALFARGAPVPRPVFAAGRFGPLGWRAVLGSACVAGALDGATALERALGLTATEPQPRTGQETEAPGEPAQLDLSTLMRGFGRAIRAFHDAGGWHADLAITNLLYSPEDGRAWIVDLQGGRAGSVAPRRRRHRELARLRRSIERRPAIAAGLEAGWQILIRAYEDAPGNGTLAGASPDGAADFDSQRAQR